MSCESVDKYKEQWDLPTIHDCSNLSHTYPEIIFSLILSLLWAIVKYPIRLSSGRKMKKKRPKCCIWGVFYSAAPFSPFFATYWAVFTRKSALYPSSGRRLWEGRGGDLGNNQDQIHKILMTKYYYKTLIKKNTRNTITTHFLMR